MHGITGKEIGTKVEQTAATQVSQPLLLIPFGFKTLKKKYTQKRSLKMEQGGNKQPKLTAYINCQRPMSLSCKKY